MENKIGMAKQNGSSVEVHDVEGHYSLSKAFNSSMTHFLILFS